MYIMGLLKFLVDRILLMNMVQNELINFNELVTLGELYHE